MNEVEIQVRQKSPRIEYIDAMRGAAIIAVVYGHLCGLALHIHSDIADAISLVHMPVFFFISGYLSYAVYTPELKKSRLYSRVMSQLLPTVVVWLLCMLSFGTSIAESVFDTYKGGYWFTFVMVEVFVAYVMLAYVFRKASFSKRQQTLTLLSVMAICVLISVLLLATHCNNKVIGCISLYYFR